MAEKIKITLRGDDGHKIISVRMKEETVARLDVLSSSPENDNLS